MRDRCVADPSETVTLHRLTNPNWDLDLRRSSSCSVRAPRRRSFLLSLRLTTLCLNFPDNTTIAPNYQAVLHVGSIRQTVRIISIRENEKQVLRTGDRATVVFEFVGNPEFLKEGMKLLFREGKTKGLGVVTKVGV